MREIKLSPLFLFFCFISTANLKAEEIKEVEKLNRNEYAKYDKKEFKKPSFEKATVFKSEDIVLEGFPPKACGPFNNNRKEYPFKKYNDFNEKGRLESREDSSYFDNLDLRILRLEKNYLYLEKSKIQEIYFEGLSARLENVISEEVMLSPSLGFESMHNVFDRLNLYIKENVNKENEVNIHIENDYINNLDLNGFYKNDNLEVNLAISYSKINYLEFDTEENKTNVSIYESNINEIVIKNKKTSEIRITEIDSKEIDMDLNELSFLELNFKEDSKTENIYITAKKLNNPLVIEKKGINIDTITNWYLDLPIKNLNFLYDLNNSKFYIEKKHIIDFLTIDGKFKEEYKIEDPENDFCYNYGKTNFLISTSSVKEENIIFKKEDICLQD